VCEGGGGVEEWRKERTRGIIKRGRGCKSDGGGQIREMVREGKQLRREMRASGQEKSGQGKVRLRGDEKERREGRGIKDRKTKGTAG